MRGPIFHKYANILLLHQPPDGSLIHGSNGISKKKLFNVEAQKCSFSKLPRFTVPDFLSPCVNFGSEQKKEGMVKEAEEVVKRITPRSNVWME